jgi:nitrogen fixation NifU-like protein
MARAPRTFREHFLAPLGRGGLEAPSSQGEAENQVCGDWVRLQVRWDGERIGAVAMHVRGCSATIACASLVVEALEGLDLAGARALDVRALAESAGAGPRDLSHAPAVVSRALLETLAHFP